MAVSEPHSYAFLDLYSFLYFPLSTWLIFPSMAVAADRTRPRA